VIVQRNRPGAGRALAEWIVEGEPTMDLSEVDVARFHPFQTNKRYLHERALRVVVPPRRTVLAPIGNKAVTERAPFLFRQ